MHETLSIQFQTSHYIFIPGFFRQPASIILTTGPATVLLLNSAALPAAVARKTAKARERQRDKDEREAGRSVDEATKHRCGGGAVWSRNYSQTAGVSPAKKYHWQLGRYFLMRPVNFGARQSVSPLSPKSPRKLENRAS